MLTAAFKFARPRIIITCSAVLLLGAAAGGRLTWALIPALLALILSVIHANSINDYTDLEIDRVNLATARDRPLVTGDITIAGFWVVHLSSAVALLLVSLLLGWRAGLAAIAILTVDYMYSLKPVRLTERAVLSPLCLALAYVYFPFSLGWWSTGPSGPFPWLLSLGLCFGFVARMLLKDFRDRLGDQRHGKTTFLLRYGAHVTIGVSVAAWILATLTLGLATGSPAVTSALAVGTAMVILWLRRLAAARTHAAQEDTIKAIAIAGNWAILSVVVFYFCRALGLDPMTTQLLPAVLALGAFSVDFLHHYIEAGYSKTAH
jgi:4-hydroxybenzoate polyprenyltransferase